MLFLIIYKLNYYYVNKKDYFKKEKLYGNKIRGFKKFFSIIIIFILKKVNDKNG